MLVRKITHCEKQVWNLPLGKKFINLNLKIDGNASQKKRQSMSDAGEIMSGKVVGEKVGEVYQKLMGSSLCRKQELLPHSTDCFYSWYEGDEEEKSNTFFPDFFFVEWKRNPVWGWNFNKNQWMVMFQWTEERDPGSNLQAGQYKNGQNGRHKVKWFISWTDFAHLDIA